jgi:hypothetical protein
MRTQQDGSTRRLSVLTHIFNPEFLARMAERDEPETAAEADAAGTWHSEPHPRDLWAVLREGESLEIGSIPTAVFLRKELAQIASAVLPGTGRRLRFRLGPDAEELGFPIRHGSVLAGWSRYFDEDFVAALNVVDALLSAPREFAWLLEAIGGLTLEHVDAITVARLAQE